MIRELIATLFLWGAQVSDKLETAFLAANIYHESRGESSEGQLCVAYVTIARAGDNNPTFGGPTLRSVVFKENVREDGRLTAEFSWWERPSMPRDYEAVATAWMLAQRARQVRQEFLCSLKGVRYYKNSDAAGPGGSCWFMRNAVYVGSVGNHDFYRPQRTVFEWKQGRSRDCYIVASRTASRVMPRTPRPRPPFASTEEVRLADESVPRT
jgi:spore germination cell wall hydrolase CwlJ-like protein